MYKTLLIDNFDSFTYNLFQYLGEIGAQPIVYKNNALTISQIKVLEPTHIVISPGPGSVLNKSDFGICDELLTFLETQGILGKCVPVLGVCLGHQGIIRHFGGDVQRAPQIMHGKQSEVRIIAKSILFKDFPDVFPVMRYHSLIGVQPNEQLKVTAVTNDPYELIMSVSHVKLPIYGVQFHPESIGTPFGKQMLRNFYMYSKAIKIS